MNPFICHVYSQFNNKSELDQHILFVHKEKNLLSCHTSFTPNSPQNEHISSIHGREKPYTCSDFNSRFYKIYDLNEHIASNHENNKKSVPLTNDRFQKVKQQCGRHSLSKVNINTLFIILIVA